MNGSKYLYLNSRDDFFRVETSRIVYFESDGNYTHIILSNKIRGTVSVSLSQMQEILRTSLPDDAASFARIGKRHIINLAYVYHIAIQRQNLTLSDGQSFEYKLPVSKDALKTLRDFYVKRTQAM